MKVTLCAVPVACLLTVEAATLIRLPAHRREGEALGVLGSATACTCEPCFHRVSLGEVCFFYSENTREGIWVLITLFLKV